MSDPQPLPPIPPLQLGGVEPHAGLLAHPPDSQLLYKLMTIENLLRSIDGAYLHFSRVDQYTDSPIADPHDGQQLPADAAGNAGARFQKAPAFSAAHYYDRSRARTYACCFGLENADYLWRHYGSGSERGKVCVVFSFSKLREALNRSFAPDSARLVVDGVVCQQVLSLNYGIVRYVAWHAHQANNETLLNPIYRDFPRSQRAVWIPSCSAVFVLICLALPDARAFEPPSKDRLHIYRRACVGGQHPRPQIRTARQGSIRSRALLALRGYRVHLPPV